MWTTLNLWQDKIESTTDKLGLSSYLILLLFNIVYFSTLFGIVIVNTKYLSIFNILVHSGLCLFLMYRFNPLRKNIEIKRYDQLIIFSIALFLLINLGIIEFIQRSILDGKQLLLNNTK